LFTVLSAHVGPDPDAWQVTIAGAVIELVHLATLYHDDVMDEAQVRRGAESANARWGNNIAILAGDYLFAAASKLVSRLGPDAVRIIAETFAQLVTGQMRETKGATPGNDPVAHYLKVIAEKTACLIAASGRLGGTFSGATDDQVERLARIGEIVGTVFQISDDIIDIEADPDDSGKLPGTDLREGVHTLPRWQRRWSCCAPPGESPQPRTRCSSTPARPEQSSTVCRTGRDGAHWLRWWITRLTGTAEQVRNRTGFPDVTLPGYR
jgi:heptaprenyl diphosphate synthase